MGTQINTQPQTFKSASTVMGAAAGLSAVSGLTVYGDISASGAVTTTGATVYGNLSASGKVYYAHPTTKITCTGAATYTINGYVNDDATNYAVYLDGVRQIPTDDYTISSTSGGSITFIPAPASGVVAFVTLL